MQTHTQVSLMPTPVQQIRHARMLNHLCKWRLTDHAFYWHSAPLYIPHEDFVSELPSTQAIVLDIGLKDFSTTFTGALKLIQMMYPDVGYTTEMSPDNVVAVGDHFIHNNLSWKVIDFAAPDHEISVNSTRKEKGNLPNTALLWAMIWNPKLLENLNKLGIYGVWLGGCTFSPDCTHVPRLWLDGVRNVLEFGSGHVGNLRNGRSIPTFAQKPWACD